MWPKLECNNVTGPRLFNHQQMMCIRPRLYEPLAFHLETLLIRFLWDFNLSYKCLSAGFYISNARAQRNAFLRFARSLEDTLESVLKEHMWRQQELDQISQALAGLRL
jgi:hypothetical protein